MPWHIAANALGIILAAGYAGYVINAERIPWGGLSAAVLYMAGIAVPMLHAYFSIDSGFQRIEEDYVANRRREHFPPEQEILDTPRPAPVIRRRAKPMRAIVILMALATGFLIADAADWIINPPDPQSRSDTISNF